MKPSSDDQAWFQQLFHEQYSGLVNYAYQLVKDRQTAEDIVQSVMVNLWKRRQEIEKGDKLDRLLVKAVKNRCIDYWRTNKKLMLIDDFTPLGLTAETSDREVSLNETRALVAKAISELPPRTRQVFVLSRKEGLTYNEIAETLELSVKTIENQMSRALRHLRTFYEKHLSDLS